MEESAGLAPSEAALLGLQALAHPESADSMEGAGCSFPNWSGSGGSWEAALEVTANSVVFVRTDTPAEALEKALFL